MSKTANNGKDIPWVSDGVSTAKAMEAFAGVGKGFVWDTTAPNPIP